MTQTIVNLTLPVIEQKVEKFLANSTQVNVDTTGAAIALQEKLVAYVLRRMPTFYVTTEWSQKCSIGNPVSCFSQAQQREMDQLIDEGLQHLITRRSSWEASAQNSSSAFEPSPSHWFG